MLSTRIIWITSEILERACVVFRSSTLIVIQNSHTQNRYDPQGIFQKEEEVWKYVIEKHHKKEKLFDKNDLSLENPWKYALKMMYTEKALEHAIRLSHPTKTTKISAVQDVERCWRCGVDTGGKHTNTCIEEQKREERKRKEKEEEERKKKEEKEREKLRKRKERERKKKERQKKENEKELLKQRTNEEKKNVPSYLPDANQSEWRKGENVYWKRIQKKKKYGNFVFGTLIPSLETASHVVARLRKGSKRKLLKKREGFDWRRKPCDKCMYVGDRVEAQFATGWYNGSVTRVLEDGTYDVDYDDGDKEKGVKRNEIYYAGKKKKKRKGLLSVGDRVSAYFNGMFYPCTITRVRRNKQYDILYDDGETDTKMSIDLMRRIPTDGVRKANDDSVRKANDDSVRKRNDKQVRKANHESDSSSSYFKTMLEPTIVSETKRGRKIKQVKRFFASFEGGNDWYDTQKELVKEDLKALKDSVYHNGNVSSTDGVEIVLQKKKDDDTSKRKLLQKRKKDNGNTSKIANVKKRRKKDDQREKKIESMENTILPVDDFVVKSDDMIPVPPNYDVYASDSTLKCVSSKRGVVSVKVHFLDPKTGLIDKKRTAFVQIVDMDGNIATFKQDVKSQVPGSEHISKFLVFNMPTHSNPIFGDDEKTYCCERISDSMPTNDILKGIDFVPHLLFCPPVLCDPGV